MTATRPLRWVAGAALACAAALAFALAASDQGNAAAAVADPLSCNESQLRFAPRLASDHGTPPEQTLDARGRYVPIILVHGWTSRSTHGSDRTGSFSRLIDLSTDPGYKPAAERSLVGQLQKIPGAAVFTFDYHDYSARWVDDDHLGPALGEAIDCLYEKSGEKVIVVGHSMGGLIARWAVTHDAAGGTPRAQHVSTVVTMGTPQTGSLVAALAAGVIDVGSASGNRVLEVLRLILSYCGSLTGVTFKTGTLCDMLPDFLQAFDTPAGRALRTGSRQLHELPGFPRSVTTLDALAGETTIHLDAGWFGVPEQAPSVDVGDVIVLSGSATKYSTQKLIGRCEYNLNAARSASEEIALSLGLPGRSGAAQPLWKVFGACFHTNLMRTISLTNQATGVIDDDISGRPANGSAQPALTPETVSDDDLPVCGDYKQMSKQRQDVVLRRMQEAHGDTLPRIVVRGSVSLFCKLNEGRRIDGVYAPGSRAPSSDGGSGPTPSCQEWRAMDDAAGDAALLRLARERGDDSPSISTMRLTVGAYCAITKGKRIDGAYGG